MTAVSTAPILASMERPLARVGDLAFTSLEDARRPNWVARQLAACGLMPAAWRPATVPEPIESLVRTLPAGGWRIRRDTAFALGALFMEAAPMRVLEMGSGVSTVLLAALCAASGRAARVVSLEENPTYADRTRRLLADFALADHATVLATPVARTTIGGWTGQTYRPDEAAMRRALNGGAIDFVFVDGPASWGLNRGDCRFGALPLIAGWAAPRLVFALDDAWRRRDLAILKRWNELPGVAVRGVIPVGRGLGVGTVESAAAA